MFRVSVLEFRVLVSVSWCQIFGSVSRGLGWFRVQG